MIPELIQKIVDLLKRRSKLWFIIWIFLFLIVPILLIEIHIFIINGLNFGEISETTIFTIYTNTTNPSVPSLFATNFVHKLNDQGSHLLQNVAVYLLFIFLIFLAETFILLPNDSKRSEKDFYYPLLLFFFILPFSVSSLSLVIFRIIGGTGFNGFSGIVAAFLGYFWFMLFNVYFSIRENVILKNPQKIRKMDFFFFGCFFFPILSFALMNIVSYDNFGGHTTGYVFGFFSGYGMYLVREEKVDKIIIALIFAIVIWIISTFWIFF